MNWYFGICDNTTNKFKKILRNLYKKYIEARPIFLGGPGVIVEVNETVLSRRGVISRPTSTSDDVRDTVWIVSAIDHTNEKNFCISKVPNRKIATLTNYLEQNVLVGSILYTDGYPSYPSVARNLSLQHHVVNHSHGFVAVDGTLTNNIEGLWSNLKSSMRKENGVKRINIDEWIAEYTFKRRYLMNRDKNSVGILFIELLKIFLN